MGKSLKFGASIRMSVRRGDILKENGEQIGHQMRVRIIKNKIAVPYKEANINLIYGQGIDRVDELFQIALKAGLIKQGGAWFTIIDDETGEIKQYDGKEARTQGRDKMINLIRETPSLFAELETKIRGVKVLADDIDAEEVETLRLQEGE